MNLRYRYFFKSMDCPGGTDDKDSFASAGDTGLGRAHMLQSCLARVPRLLSPALQPLKPAGLEPVFRNKRSLHNEKPSHQHEE